MKMRFLALLAVFTLGSCASYFKRQTCNDINWFQHGYDVAMKGIRVDADQTVQDCRKVDAEIDWAQMDQGFKSGMANYCKPEVVFATGKKGEFFNTDLCDVSDAKQLKLRHADGVQMFCSKQGYSFGASGKKYNQICPKDLEDGFLIEYRRGRKSYLGLQIRESERKVREMKSELNRLRNKKSYVEGKIQMHRTRRPQKTVSRFNPETRVREESDNPQYGDWKKMDRKLDQELRDYERKISSNQSQIQSQQDEISNMKVERNAMGAR